MERDDQFAQRILVRLHDTQDQLRESEARIAVLELNEAALNDRLQEERMRVAQQADSLTEAENDLIWHHKQHHKDLAQLETLNQQIIALTRRLAEIKE